MEQISKDEREFMLNRLITRTIAAVVVVIFLSITTCTMHMNSYNPEEAKAEAAATKAKIEVQEAKHTAEMARLKLVEELISKEKVDPLAARCAVEGWDDESAAVCLEIVKGKAAPAETNPSAE